MPSRILSYRKIVKGERRDKRKTKFSGLAMPSRILSYRKTVKGERRDKRKTKFSGLAMPSRILSYRKIVKGGRGDKRKTKFSGWAMPSRILSCQKTVKGGRGAVPASRAGAREKGTRPAVRTHPLSYLFTRKRLRPSLRCIRQIQSVSFYLWHDVLPILCGHWL